MKYFLLLFVFVFFTNSYACSPSMCYTFSLPCFNYGKTKPGVFNCEEDISYFDLFNATETNKSILIHEQLKDYAQKNKMTFNPEAIGEPKTNATLIEEYDQILIRELSLDDDTEDDFKEWRKKLNQKTIPDFETKNLVFGKFTAGLKAFYEMNYDIAIPIFVSLSETAPSFTAEYSHYLAIRSALLMAQKEWDGYSDAESSSKINQLWLKAAEELMNSFVKKYSRSKFLTSTKDLFRKVAFLKKDKKTFFNLLDKRFDELSADNKIKPDVKRYYLEGLINEELKHVDPYSLNDIDAVHPVVMPYFLTKSFSYFGKPEEIEALMKKLLSLKKKFANYPAEWAVSYASALLLQKKYAEVIKTIDESKEKGPSLKALKARALIQLKKYADARTEAKDLKDDRLKSLIYYYEGDYKKAFLKTSEVGFNEAIAKEAIKAFKPAELLELINHPEIKPEYKTAFEKLLSFHAIVHSDLQSLAKMNSETYKEQIKDANDSFGTQRVNEAKFSLAKYLGTSPLYIVDYRQCSPENINEYDYLKDSMKIPLHYYYEIVKSLDPKKQYEYEPELLSILLKCFQYQDYQLCNLGAGNEGMKNQVPMKTRRKWFLTLKKKYPESPYATNLRFFY